MYKNVYTLPNIYHIICDMMQVGLNDLSILVEFSRLEFNNISRINNKPTKSERDALFYIKRVVVDNIRDNLNLSVDLAIVDFNNTEYVTTLCLEDIYVLEKLDVNTNNMYGLAEALLYTTTILIQSRTFNKINYITKCNLILKALQHILGSMRNDRHNVYNSDLSACENIHSLLGIYDIYMPYQLLDVFSILYKSLDIPVLIINYVSDIINAVNNIRSNYRCIQSYIDKHSNNSMKYTDSSQAHTGNIVAKNPFLPKKSVVADNSSDSEALYNFTDMWYYASDLFYMFAFDLQLPDDDVFMRSCVIYKTKYHITIYNPIQMLADSYRNYEALHCMIDKEEYIVCNCIQYDISSGNLFILFSVIEPSHDIITNSNDSDENECAYTSTIIPILIEGKCDIDITLQKLDTDYIHDSCHAFKSYVTTYNKLATKQQYSINIPEISTYLVTDAIKLVDKLGNVLVSSIYDHINHNKTSLNNFIKSVYIKGGNSV